jgi:hypothetical protein
LPENEQFKQFSSQIASDSVAGTFIADATDCGRTAETGCMRCPAAAENMVVEMLALIQSDHNWR